MAASAYTPGGLDQVLDLQHLAVLMSRVVIGELAAGGDAAGAVGQAADAVLEHGAGVAGDGVAVGRGKGDGFAVDVLMGSLHGLHQGFVALELEAVAGQVQVHLGAQLGVVGLEPVQHGLDLLFDLHEALARHHPHVHVEVAEGRRALGGLVGMTALDGADADASLHERMRMTFPVRGLPRLEGGEDTHHLFDGVDAVFLGPRVLGPAVDCYFDEAIAGLADLQAHAGGLPDDGVIRGDAVGHQITRAYLAAAELHPLVLVHRRLLGLAHDSCHQDVPGQLHAGPLERPQRTPVGGERAFHVAGAEPVDPPIGGGGAGHAAAHDVGRILAAPRLGLAPGGAGVEVAAEEQRGRALAAGQPAHHVVAAGLHLLHLHPHTQLGQASGEIVAGGRFRTRWTENADHIHGHGHQLFLANLGQHPFLNIVHVRPHSASCTTLPSTTVMSAVMCRISSTGAARRSLDSTARSASLPSSMEPLPVSSKCA